MIVDKNNIFLVFLILYFPFASFLASFIAGFLIGKKGSIISSLTLIGSCLVLIIFFFCHLIMSNGSFSILLNLGEWFSVGFITVQWEFLFNSLSIFMLVIIFTISFLVHLFSVDYMKNDPNIIKFFSFLSLFTFFMVILVTANNFLVLFIGWEGVGLCSYLLINFWYTRVQCNKAANKALIVNKIGDFFLVTAIASIIFTFNSCNFDTIFSLAHLYYYHRSVVIMGITFNSITFISLFLFLAAMAKSAQIFLHTWLPDAMEGPTPVSALIHAATMVTAGVFLIIKCSFIIDLSKSILLLMVYVGVFTSIFAGLIGLFQYDIKKIIAYSTCSQLGYMVFSCGLSGYNLSLFHLFNHAFFKALLFLSAGSIIHSLSGEQDIRRMGGLYKIMPFTYICFVIGVLSLTGVPFFSGSFSKDPILELAYLKLFTPSTSHLFFLAFLELF